MEQYAYKYAIIMAGTGLCRGTSDTSNYILDPLYVPIEDTSLPYLMKYYHPIPDEVTDFSDFNGKWYSDSSYNVEVPELNG